MSAGADVVFTIVTDDAAMWEIFTSPDNLWVTRRKIVYQLRHRLAGDSCGSRAISGSRRGGVPGSLHGFQHHTGA